jgi:hypothetical protein
MVNNIEADFRGTILTRWTDIYEFDYELAGKLRLSMVELYFHLHIFLYRTLLNYLSSVTAVK